MLELTVDDAVVQRLLKRAEFEGRSDDTEEVIRARRSTARRPPRSPSSTPSGLLVQVDGMGEVDEVADRIDGALAFLMFGRSRIEIKTADQIARMRRAGRPGQTLQLMAQTVRPGMTTKALDELAEEHIRGCGAVPSFLGYHGS